MEKVSYALGLSLGSNLKSNGLDGLDYKKLAKGIEDLMEGAQPEMSIEEAQAIINAYFQDLQNKAFEANIAEGKKFLAENAAREGVVTLESGLQYEV